MILSRISRASVLALLLLATRYSLLTTAQAQPAPVLADPTTGALFRPAAATFITGNGLLTTASAAAAYQPLDADLTSWAAVTRASGFDTFTATPSSANLASLVTGETGTGALVFGTSPTLTAPILGTIVNTGTLTLPTSTDTLVGRATTDTLTNKSISLGSNTLTATSAQLITAVSDETGSGALVFATSPTFTTPILGAATATSVTGPTTTDLTLSGGSSGASLVLGQGASAGAQLALPGVGVFAVSNVNDAGFVNVARFLSPSLSSGNSALIMVGKAASSNQSAFLNYVYNSTAASTRLDFGHNGSTGQMSLTQPGNLLLGTTSDPSSLTGGLVLNGSGAGATASSTTTGTLRVTGGAGFTGAGYFGGALNSASTTEATTGGAGSITTAGGIYAAKAIIANGNLITTTQTPASAAAAGVAGTITWDANYIYVCTATNTWKRVAIATW